MRKFEILFDSTPAGAAGLVGNPVGVTDPAFAIYGPLSFPEPPPERPWTFSNFVQSLDGITSFKGKDASGAAISASAAGTTLAEDPGAAADRWLMDLLRAHADAVMTGANTLIEETENGPRARGPLFRIMDAGLRALRQKLGRGREMNIIVTGAARLNLADFRLFDGQTPTVDAVILTTRAGAARLVEKRKPPWVRVVACGETDFVPLDEAVRLLRRELGIRYLLCEGGPTLYGWLARAGLVDEKFVTVSPVEIGQFVPPEQDAEDAPLPEPRLPLPVPRAAEMKLRPTTFFAPGFTRATAPHWEWLSCRRVGDHQFSRYRRRR